METIRLYLKKPYVLLLLSACLAALPLTFPNLFLLSWVGFVPFFLVILQSENALSLRSVFGRGLFFGFVYHALIYFWFLWMYPLDFAGLNRVESILVVCLAWLGISFLHGILFAIPTLLSHVISKWTANAPFRLFAALFGVLLAEKITELSALAFPWVHLSLGQYRAPLLIQTASLWGIEGVDFLILTVSALLAYAIHFPNKKRVALSLALSVFCANLLFGVVSLNRASEEEGKGITVTAIQGSILASEQWGGESSALETYTTLTEEKVSKDCDLVLWPEGAVPFNLHGNESLQDYYESLSEAIDSPILMGSFWRLDGKSANSAVLLSSDGILDVYTKRHLVPFGEYLPYRGVLSKLLPILEEINVLEEDMAEGTDSALLETEKGKIGSIICFESVFPDLALESARDGAELFVILTNDSWYKDSTGVWQHLAHAVFRSVENGRASVRSAASGVTAFIDKNGRILSEIAPLERGTLSHTVSFTSETTVYTALGRVFLPFLGVLYVLSFAILFVWERRRGNAR